MKKLFKLPVALFLSVSIGSVASAQTNYTLLETNTDHNSPIESLTLAPDGVTMITGHHDGYHEGIKSTQRPDQYDLI
jgi:hypothetical protein